MHVYDIGLVIMILKSCYKLIALYVLGVGIYIAIFGEGIYIPVHDHLDSYIVYYKVLHDTNTFFSSDVLLPYLGGIQRDYFPSELKIYSLPFLFLSPFHAIICNSLLRIVISVAGSIWLGKTVLKKGYDDYENIIVLCGFIYSLIPVNPVWDIPFSVYPALIAIGYKVYFEHWNKGVWFLFIIPFFSELAHFGIFICSAIMLLFFFDLIIKQKLRWNILLSIVSLSMGYIVSEYRMFRLVYVNHVETIKTSMLPSMLSYEQCMEEMWYSFKYGQYHAASSHLNIVLPTCSIVLFLFVLSKYFDFLNKEGVKCIRAPFFIVFALIVFNCIVCGISNYDVFIKHILSILPILRGIQLQRIIRWNPFLWYLEFAMALIAIAQYGKKKVIYCLIGAAFLSVILEPNVYTLGKQNLSYQYHNLIKRERSNDLNYSEFYSVSLFNKIKDDIGYDGKWSIAFGMHPAILAYNGISILDGYHAWYSQEYKNEFREIIAPELDIDEKARKYFDNWGGRAYAFSNEIGFAPIKQVEKEEAELHISIEDFKRLQGKYIFSRVRIKNFQALHLKFLNEYTDVSSPYHIYLYEVV